ncbi:MAG: lysine--tRNA ligase, partial [Sphingobacteriaceae bacterium]
MSTNLSEQEILRREALQNIRNLGINPYTAEAYQITTNAQDILQNFLDQPEKFQEVQVAGRIMSRRIM